MEETGNYIEAVFWSLIGAIFLAMTWRRRVYPRVRYRTVAVTFLVFGLSDYVEAHTGAWWRPWWLFFWKAVCVVVLFWEYLVYRRERARAAGAIMSGDSAKS